MEDIKNRFGVNVFHLSVTHYKLSSIVSVVLISTFLGFLDKICSEQFFCDVFPGIIVYVCLLL